MIKKEDLKRVKTVTDYENFDRVVRESIHANDNLDEGELCIPVARETGGKIHFAVIEVTEEEAAELCDAVLEKVRTNSDN